MSISNVRPSDRLLKITRFLAVIFSVVLSFGVRAADGELTVAVLYPQIKEPYNQVFENITLGIGQTVPGWVKTLVLTDDTDQDAVTGWLRERKADGVITLGSRAMAFAPTLAAHYPVVIGAVNLTSNENALPGISMLPAPYNLLQQLKTLQPEITRVHVVIQPGQQDWWLAHAKSAAQKLNLTLIAHPVTDMGASARQYHSLLDNLNPKSEALWLASAPAIMDGAIVLDVLDVAWQRKLTVFSNRLSEVKRGALFSLYPDNVGMGASLANKLLRNMQDPKSSTEITLLSDLKSILNVRTAKHIGLHFSKSELRNFDLIYPAQ